LANIELSGAQLLATA